MKIGTVTASISRQAGGLFESVRALSKATDGISSAEVSVFGSKDAFTSADVQSWSPLQVSMFDVVGPRRFGFSPRLLGALENANLDVLHVHGIWMYPSVAAMRWSKRSGRPYVVSPHGMLDRWAVRNAHWKKRLAHLLYQNAHLAGASCLRALCEAEAEAMRSYGLVNPIAIIPNGVSLPGESGEPGCPAWTARSPKGSKHLLFLGRIHPKKGLSELIQAWVKVKRKGVFGALQWHLVIGGWDEVGQVGALDELAKAGRVRDTVHFVGPLFGNEKESSFRYADAFILPSFSEGLPMAVLEAWSYSLPVVLTPKCNLPCGVHANAAVECKPQVDSIAEALARLFAMSDDERDRMGRSGRSLVERDFVWTKIGGEMVAVYRWILGSGPRPTCVTQRGI